MGPKPQIVWETVNIYKYIYIKYIMNPILIHTYILKRELEGAIEGERAARMPRSVCCSVLQCVAVCFSVFQCVAVCCSVLQRVGAVLQCDEV